MKRLWYKFKGWLSKLLFRTPAVIDWTINVQSKQRYGTYNLLVTDMGNRSYDIGVGAFITGEVGMPKDRWQEVVDSIDVGSVLKVRIRAEELADTGSSAISVLRVNGIGYGR